MLLADAADVDDGGLVLLSLDGVLNSCFGLNGLILSSAAFLLMFQMPLLDYVCLISLMSLMSSDGSFQIIQGVKAKNLPTFCPPKPSDLRTGGGGGGYEYGVNITL